jgi:hypothetical protein
MFPFWRYVAAIVIFLSVYELIRASGIFVVVLAMLVWIQHSRVNHTGFNKQGKENDMSFRS